MSLIGVLRTGVSGMNAQSSRISTVAENVQNASTTGYKRTSTEFSSLLLDPGGSGNYNSGAVEPVVRRAIGEQGNVAFTNSASDIAIQGDGFFMVQDAGGGGQYLTRAGNFVVDGSTGNLVNAGGFTLLGYSLLPNGEPDTSKGLIPISLPSKALQARPSSQGTLGGNLPYATPVHSGAPGTAAGAYDKKTSVTTYDNVGQAVTYDVYMTKTASDTWSISVYDGQTPPAQVGSTATVTFDANGKALSATPITIPASATSRAVTIDLAGLTQLAGDYDVKGTADGAAPSSGTGIAFGSDGTVYTTYADGKRSPTYRVPLADVRSPDELLPKAGNVFEATNDSGKVEMGFAGIGGRGTVKSGALEQSNVDVSTELTTMIESQSVYTANSKVFMTGNEMLDTLMNLKR